MFVSSERLPSVTTVSIPGHGTLQGVAVETAVASDSRTVIQFLGVPYARPPIGSLRFEAAQPANWMGTWDATKPRSVPFLWSVSTKMSLDSRQHLGGGTVGPHQHYVEMIELLVTCGV